MAHFVRASLRNVTGRCVDNEANDNWSTGKVNIKRRKREQQVAMIFIPLDVHLSLFFRLLRLSISDETMNLDHQLKDTDDHHDFPQPS